MNELVIPVNTLLLLSIFCLLVYITLAVAKDALDGKQTFKDEVFHYHCECYHCLNSLINLELKLMSKISPSALNIAINAALTIAFPATAGTANPLPVTGATYASSNPAVATIDPVSGVVTPVAQGDTVITGTATVIDPKWGAVNINREINLTLGAPDFDLDLVVTNAG